jgi:glutathione S-transferase
VLIYHLTFDADWDPAVTVGSYRVSGRGMTLESEGFLHFSYADQVAGVAERFWRDPEGPVVLLAVDPELLDLPVIAENTSGGTELFPHLYGPLPVAAVVTVTPVEVDADGALIIPDLPS